MGCLTSNLAGKRVFDSGFAAGKTLQWNLLNTKGSVVADRVYLYVVTVRGFDGTELKSEVQRVVVLR